MQLSAITSVKPEIAGYATPVLQDYHILRKIFAHLDVDSHPIEPGMFPTKKYLLLAALVCRAFRDPALDSLWSSMDSLVPLLKLLPSFKLIDNIYVFQGVFHKADWDRFDDNARRVMKFTLNGADMPDVAPSTYFRLAQLRPSPLPLLREFRCLSVAPSIPYILLFTSPRLQRVELDGPGLYDSVGPVLSALAYDSTVSPPPLRQLVLRGPAFAISLDSLGQFSQLLTLEVSAAIPLGTFTEIGTLKYLENLIVTLPSTPDQLDDDIGFERLKNLHITAPFALVDSVLDQMTTGQLESITVVGLCIASQASSVNGSMKEKGNGLMTGGKKELMKGKKKKSGMPQTKVSSLGGALPSTPVYDLWRSCFLTLSSRWSSSLLSISIHLDESAHAFEGRMAPGLFSQILPFQRLEHLSIQNCRFSPLEDEIQDLGSACPNLRELHISVADCITSGEYAYSDPWGSHYSTSRMPPASTNIAALWVLADLCPHLNFLEIGLNIDQLPPFHPNRILSHGLRTLSIGSLSGPPVDPYFGAGEPSPNPMLVARHIDRLFPYLEDVKTHAGYGSDDWKRVNDMVKMYQSVRLDDATRRVSAPV